MAIDLEALRPRRPGLDPAKAVLLALAACYVAPTVLDPERGNLLFGVIFYTHEAGHVLFSPFGTFLTILGGTITQLAVPVAFGVAFWRRGDPYAAAVTGFWLAMSFLQASSYAGDAIALEHTLSHTWMSGQEELEQFGSTRHDWRNMLEMLGLLRATPVVAFGLRAMGTLAFALSLWAGLVAAGAPVPARLSWPPRPKAGRKQRPARRGK